MTMAIITPVIQTFMKVTKIAWIRAIKRGQNVGSTNATLSDDNELLPEIVLACGESDPRLTDDVLNIAVFNGYPGYQQAVDARIVNVGTVRLNSISGKYLVMKFPWLQRYRQTGGGPGRRGLLTI